MTRSLLGVSGLCDLSIIMAQGTLIKPFDQLLQKTVTLVDKSYSLEKSTFKGFVAYFKEFSSIEKEHSSKLSKLSKEAGNSMGLKYPLNECLPMETPLIKTIISEVLYASAGQSQMHYNFSERLAEMAETFSSLYQEVKTTKETAMSLLTHTYPSALTKSGGHREAEEKKCLKGIHDLLENLHQHQVHRVQKIREHVIIAFTLHKKICEKQQEMLSINNQRLSSMDSEKVAEDIQRYISETINLHNSYGGESKIQPKIAPKVVEPLKDSLRESVILKRQRVTMERVEVSKNSLRQVELQAAGEMSSLTVHLDQRFVNKRGLFNKEMPGYLEYSQRIDSLVLGRLSYALIEGYYFNKTHDQAVKAALTNIRVKLKAENKATTLSQTLNSYIQNEYNRRSEETKCMIHYLIQLSRHYNGKIDEISLRAELQQSRPPVMTGFNEQLNVWVSSVIISILLDTVVQTREGDSYLIPNSTEIFRVISEFATSYFNVQPQLTLFLFLQKIMRIQQYRESHQIDPVLEELESLLTVTECREVVSEYTLFLLNKLKNDLTDNLIHLYNVDSQNSLIIQCLCWLQLYVKSKDWVLDHIYQCVRVAGYKWVTEQDENKALLGNAWESNEKLKLLTQVLKENQFEQIESRVLRNLADKMVTELKLGYEAVVKKLREKFFTFIIQIVLLNLDTIPLSQFSDKDGYCLKLGIELCKMDILCNYNITIYENFFRMLSVGLSCMESEYKDLLLQTKKTELWLVEQNMFATQNCYDFCSLLAKPIEYMASVIKELGDEGYSPFKTKFVGTVKLKLHEILRIELVNYMAFLSHSVRKLEKPQPKVSAEPPKVDKISVPRQQQLSNEYSTFKQHCKRLNNIIFIKQNSNQIVKDMLAPQTFDRLQDIFNVDALKREMEGGRAEEKELLAKIQEIVKEMFRYEDRTIFSVATGTVLTTMKPLLDRLYWREPKHSATLETFFTGGNNQGVKLSQHTLMTNKEILQDYVMLIKRNVPIEHYGRFCQFFFGMLALGVKCEILNPHKFRIPIEVSKVYDYLNVDIANITNVMKKECTDEESVIKYFYQPLKKTLEEFREDPNKLTERYERAMITKNQGEIDESLCILYIRGATDKRLKEFVKRVKPH